MKKHKLGLGLAFAFYILSLAIMLIGCWQVTSQHILSVFSQDSTARPDFRKMDDTRLLKAAFFAYIRPLVEQQNHHIAAQRDYLHQLQQKVRQGNTLNHREQRFIYALASEYSVFKKDAPQVISRELFERLNLRVDTIPTALVLSQAAIESAWGKSRFAREANNFFGQWCYTRNCGLVPKQRSSEANHEVKYFTSSQSSVNAYINNLNTHRSYQQLREIRAQARRKGKTATAYQLADGLINYSQQRQAYIEKVRRMIRDNKLEQQK